MNFHVRAIKVSIPTFENYVNNVYIVMFETSQWATTRQLYYAIPTSPAQTNMGPSIIPDIDASTVYLPDHWKSTEWDTLGFTTMDVTYNPVFATEVATCIKAGIANNTDWRTSSYLGDYYSSINDFNLIIGWGFLSTIYTQMAIFYPGSDDNADSILVV